LAFNFIQPDQISHFTLDNASNNDTFMVKLQNCLLERDHVFDHRDQRIMCFPHIINICCQHVINDFTDTTLAEAANVFVETLPPDVPDRQTFADALKRDPITLGRNIVQVLQGSGQRRDSFDELIRDGNERGWFEGGNPPTIIQLKHLQLLRDVRTRWDSVYFMIKRLRELRPVCNLRARFN
jgi:hypothetical protein